MKVVLRTPVLQTVAGVALCLCHGVINAQGFADDFSKNSITSDFDIFTYALANPDTAASVDDSGVLVNIVHADPSSEDRAVFQFGNSRAMNSVRSTGQFIGERPTVGTLRYESQGRFYNSIADGGLGEDDRTGDVEIELTLRMGTSAEQDVAEVCFKDRDADGNSQPLEALRNKCGFFQTAGLDVNTPYTIEIGVNRTTQELYGEFNGERITVSSPTPFYEPNNRYSWARFRVRDGAESGNFRLSSLSFDGTAADLQGIATHGRYRFDDFDDFTGDTTRSKEVTGGRLKLSASVASSDGENVSFLRFDKPSDYIEADLVYSSESTVDTTAGGFAAVRLAGVLYNDTSADLDAGGEGSVWAAVMLVNNAGSGLVGEYCVLRSDAADFSAFTDLADGMDNDRCPTFELAVSPDTVYNASMSLNQAAKTIAFKLGDEVIEYSIMTDVFKRTDTLRAQSRMLNGATGTVVGYFDNLRNDPAALTDEELLVSMGGDNGSGNNSTGGTGTEGSGTGGSAGSSSGGGGGCSIVAGQKEYSLILLLLAAFMSFFWRKAARRSE